LNLVFSLVTPAALHAFDSASRGGKAGIQFVQLIVLFALVAPHWIPAYAGMTMLKVCANDRRRFAA
jgi:hypothetical protein